jgi:prepilin-type N-terminal cleavage/methylation domain-containing protein
MKTLDSRTQSGFTLVEALIAIVILVFGLMAVTNLFLVAGNSNQVANQSTATAALASQALESLKTLPFVGTSPNVLAAGGSLTADVPNYFSEHTVPGVGRIRTRWLVSDVAGQPQLRYIQVRSEAVGVFLGARTRAEFATLRSCTAPAPDASGGCTPPAPMSGPCCPAP